MQAGDDRRHSRRITPVHGEQHLCHGLPGLRKLVSHIQTERVEYDPPGEGIAVRVQSVRRVADQHVAGAHTVAVQRRAFLYDRADPAQRERGARAAHQLGDAALRLLGGVETDARRRVAFGHGAAGASTSKWTSCLKPCTRARTSAGVTLSNPWIPKASTANDPMAAPYTIARRRFGAERSPFRARWAMKPPANASPAPVGSNTSWSG